MFNSILNILKGFLWGHIAGALLAVFASASKAFKAILTPFMSVVKSTPIASFIILVYVWIDKNNTPAFISFLIVLPVVWQNIKSGILSADEKLLEAAKIYRFNFFKKVRYIYIPSVLPYYVGAFKVSMGMAWKAGVAAEVLCAAKLTLGGAIYDSKIYLETEELFAWTIVVIIISMIIEFFTVKLLDNAAKRLSIAGRDGGI